MDNCGSYGLDNDAINKKNSNKSRKCSRENIQKNERKEVKREGRKKEGIGRKLKFLVC